VEFDLTTAPAKSTPPVTALPAAFWKPSPLAQPGPSRRHAIGFWLTGYVFAITIAFSTAPAPLYVLYQVRDHFGALLVTMIFSAYAFGVVASLFLVGHVSDWLGRRRILVLAIGTDMAAGLVFVGSPGVFGLLTGRILSGISVGMLTATATAYLSELHSAARPGASRTRAEMVAAAASLGGLGLGPLIAGFLAQYAGAPLQLPYLVLEALMLAGLAVLGMTPETVRPQPWRRYHPQRITVPPAARPTLYAAGAAVAAAFALFGLFTSLAPGLIAGTLHDRSHALAGTATFVVFGAAALAQIATSRTAPRRQLGLGLGLLTLGLAGVTMAIWDPNLGLLLIGGGLAGAGSGAVFKGSISIVMDIAPAYARGEVLAGLFLAAYLGLAVPVLGLGLATRAVSTRDALLGFSAVLAAVIVLVARRLLGTRRAGASGDMNVAGDVTVPPQRGYGGRRLGRRWHTGRIGAPGTRVSWSGDLPRGEPRQPAAPDRRPGRRRCRALRPRSTRASRIQGALACTGTVRRRHRIRPVATPFPGNQKHADPATRSPAFSASAIRIQSDRRDHAYHPAGSRCPRQPTQSPPPSWAGREAPRQPAPSVRHRPTQISAAEHRRPQLPHWLPRARRRPPGRLP
jgi:MFS family permease